MNGSEVRGYRKKTTKELLKAIDECKTLTQLFALIQHEHIVIQMTGQIGASNLVPKRLGPKEIISKKDTPFERLKVHVRKAVIEDEQRLKRSRAIAKLEEKRGNMTALKNSNKKDV